MSKVLIVEDDADQLELRRLILEGAGHIVETAANARTAAEKLIEFGPEIALLDLHLQGACGGLQLIRDFRRQRPGIRIVLLSGWTFELSGKAEAAMVDALLTKPVRSERLLGIIAKLAIVLVLILPARAQRNSFPFTVQRAGEATAEITMSAMNANWGRAGHEAAMADVRIDDGPAINVMLYAGAGRHAYPVFLGALQPGAHRVTIEQNRQYSAPGTTVAVGGIEFNSGLDSAFLAHAPVLFARQNTIGKFTDVPLIVYAEELRDGGERVLQYTVIFTNEDGGTSTRALMARWGRTTDIEYVYRVNPATHRATIQGRDHKEVEFQGRREGQHPLLIPITDNNMVGADAPSAIRYQIAPIVVDLSAHSREHVMDAHPFSYRVAAEELEREGKLRRFGTLDGEKISDPRNYLYVEAKVSNANGGLAFQARLHGESIWRSGALGRADYAISRSEWIRTTIELPPGTKGSAIAELGFECVVAPGPNRTWPVAGECRVEAVTKAFMLDQDYRPGMNLWTMREAVALASGQMRSFSISRR